MPVVTTQNTTAEAAVDVRAIDTTTAQLLLAETGTGKAGTSNIAVFGYGSGTTAGRSKLIGDALRQATDDLARKLVARLHTVPWSGRIAQVTGSQVYINAGTDLGLTSGTPLDVYRPGRAIVDQATQQLLGREEMLIGQLVVRDVQERFAIAAADQGGGFQAEDVVRLPQR